MYLSSRMQCINLGILVLSLCYVIVSGANECPTIIKRDQWGGRPSTGVNYLIVPLPYVVIHHTATPSCTTRSECSQRVVNIQSYHMDTNGWHDIGYSFLIGGDGNVYEGVGWTREGAHLYGYNKKSIGIAFIGSFEDNAAAQNMLDAAHKLITCGKAQKSLRPSVRVIGARQALATLSPGLALYNQIQNWPEWVSRP